MPATGAKKAEAREGMTRVCFLLERGNPPLNAVLAEVFTLLERRGLDVTVRCPEEDLVQLDTLIVDADVYVLGSSSELALSLATTLEALGARVLNRARASAVVKDNVLAAAIMHRERIPSPRAIVASRPAQLAPHLGAGPLILKPARGHHAADMVVADRPDALPGDDLFAGLVFAQTYLAGARTDLKVFVIGDEVVGVREPLAPGVVEAGKRPALPVDVDVLARRCGKAFGLELYGLDVAEGPGEGLAVTDVTYVPDYRGVAGAASRLASYVARVAMER